MPDINWKNLADRMLNYMAKPKHEPSLCGFNFTIDGRTFLVRYEHAGYENDVTYHKIMVAYQNSYTDISSYIETVDNTICRKVYEYMNKLHEKYRGDERKAEIEKYIFG